MGGGAVAAAVGGCGGVAATVTTRRIPSSSHAQCCRFEHAKPKVCPGTAVAGTSHSADAVDPYEVTSVPPNASCCAPEKSHASACAADAMSQTSWVVAKKRNLRIAPAGAKSARSTPGTHVMAKTGDSGGGGRGGGGGAAAAAAVSCPSRSAAGGSDPFAVSTVTFSRMFTPELPSQCRGKLQAKANRPGLEATQLTIVRLLLPASAENGASGTALEKSHASSATGERMRWTSWLPERKRKSSSVPSATLRVWNVAPPWPRGMPHSTASTGGRPRGGAVGATSQISGPASGAACCGCPGSACTSDQIGRAHV